MAMLKLQSFILLVFFVTDCSGSCSGPIVKTDNAITSASEYTTKLAVRAANASNEEQDAGYKDDNCTPVICNTSSYIGGKKRPKTPYFKVSNSGCKTASEYTSYSLLSKKCLPTPPCKQPWPISINGPCASYYSTPEEAIYAGILPVDWMNCLPKTTSGCQSPLIPNIEPIYNFCNLYPEGQCPFISYSQLRSVIILWVNDGASGFLEKKFGPVDTWIFSPSLTTFAGSDPGLFWEIRNSTDNSFWGAIYKWDTSNITNMSKVFNGCIYFNQSLDNWNVENVTNMSSMFLGASSFNQSLYNWDVENVENMSSMFLGASSFNNNSLYNWDVRKVTDMSFMFSSSNFNNDLVLWQVDNVTNMSSMFQTNIDMSQNLWQWDLNANCTFTDIFLLAHKMLQVQNFDGFTPNSNAAVPGGADGSWFNGSEIYNIIFERGWVSPNSYKPPQGTLFWAVDWYADDVSRNYIIYGNASLNIPVYGTIDEWNLSFNPAYGNQALTDLSDLFNPTIPERYAPIDSFDWNIEDWNVSMVTNMSRMFMGASSFNQDIGGWNVSKVTDMSSMFKDASRFNQDIFTPIIGNVVTDMSGMFMNAISFNQDIGDWNVDNVTTMRFMFTGASSFDQDIHSWDTDNVLDMSGMFMDTSFNQPIGNWDVEKVTTMKSMFQNNADMSQNLYQWDITSVHPTGFTNIFDNATQMLLVLNSDGFIPDKNASANGQAPGSWFIGSDVFPSFTERGWVTGTTYPTWDFLAGGTDDSSGTLFYAVDYYAYDRIPAILKYGNIDDWDLSFNPSPPVATGQELMDLSDLFNYDIVGRTDVSGMFLIADTDIQDWDVSMVTDMSRMFNGNVSFNEPLNKWNTQSVINMSSMFNGASSFDKPLDNWNVSKVTDMNSMFQGTSVFNSGIFTPIIGNVVTDMSGMFMNARSFNQDIGDWNVDNVTTMRFMFTGASSFDQDIHSWDTDNVLDMSGMFMDTSFNQPIDNWHVENVTTMKSMFQNNADMSQNLYQWDVLVDASFDNIFLDADKMLQVQNLDGFKPDQDASANGLGPGSWFIGSDVFPPFTERGWVTGESYPTWDFLAGGTDDSSGTLFYAVDYYATNQAKAILKYGHIDDWDLSFNPSPTPGAGQELMDLSDLFNYDIVGRTDVSGMFLNTDTDIQDWDVSMVTDMSRMFNGNVSFNESLNKWNTQNVRDMNNIFNGASNFDQPLDNWNVSKVTDMSHMFENATHFDSQLRKSLLDDYWDVGNVTDMSYMFNGAQQMTLRGLGGMAGWNVSSVTNMQAMFSHTKAFGSDLDDDTYGLNDWNVSNVTDMSGMFMDTVFNGDISNWDVGNVTTMRSMFNSAEFFAQPIGNWDPLIGARSVNNVQDMSDMFMNASSFNQDISSWDVSGVTTMRSMFQNAINLNSNIFTPGISNVVSDMSNMFKGASNFNQNISNWTVKNVTTMSSMFMNASSFTAPASTGQQLEPLELWFITAHKCTDMSNMFNGASNFNQYGIHFWNTDTVLNMSGMFMNASKFNQDINTMSGAQPGYVYWDVSGVTNMSNMFKGAEKFNVGQTGGGAATFDWNPKSVTDMSGMFMDASDFNQDISGWVVKNVTDMSHMFNGAQAFNYPLNGWDVSMVQNMSYMFANTVAFGSGTPTIGGETNYWYPSNVTNMSYMFINASNFNKTIFGTNSDGGSPGTVLQNVVNMSNMFNGASSFNQDLKEWNVGKVKDMSHMFQDSSFNQDISGWIVSDVTDMSRMFSGADQFNNVVSAKNPNLGWDVHQVKNMSGMFAGAAKFNNGGSLDWDACGNTGGWDTGNVTNMSYMFAYAFKFNRNLNLLDVGNVTDMNNMFRNAFVMNFNASSGSEKILWNVANVKDMSSMFRQARDFNQALYTWDVSGVTDMNNMFRQASNHRGNFKQSLQEWNPKSVTDMSEMFAYSSFGNGGSKIFNSAEATSNLKNTSGMFMEANNFNQDISGWHVDNVLDMSGMFMSASNFNHRLDTWSPSNVTSMRGMFYGASNFNSLIFGTPTPAAPATRVLSNVKNMSNMFREAQQFNQAIGGWTVDNVTSMNAMFLGQKSDNLNNFNQDLSSWNTSNVKNMGFMFMNSRFDNKIFQDVSAVTDMQHMFEYAKFYDGADYDGYDLTKWHVENVTAMNSMFKHAQTFNQDISGWVVSKVTNASNMFDNAYAFKQQSIAQWDLTVSQATGAQHQIFYGIDRDWTNIDVSTADPPPTTKWGKAGTSGYRTTGSSDELSWFAFVPPDPWTPTYPN